ncbi:MAG: acylneuraminate cytidylyltransferase family protein [Candidatus Omnitrophica bacterium]|nr:acylneuraminate cytidylyltransferase family protein [Candidatus Omnitrophota bacterium]
MEKNAKREVLAVIPARGGSKGIPGKNLTPLCGRPLIQYTIDAARSSAFISRIIVSSDDDEIISHCQRQNIEAPFKRPAEYGRDDAPMIDVIRHALSYLKKNQDYSPDFIVLLQPTSPLRQSRHIDEALEALMRSDADSVVSITEVPHNFNPYSLMKLENGLLKPFLDYDEKNNQRQKKPKFYARNGAAIYAFTYRCIAEKESIYGDKILPYFMGRDESVDIDSIFDLKSAEILLNKRERMP